MAARSREAISTIKGYYYQFDYYILQLLQLQDDADSVRIEGIEDVDIITKNSTKAVQCKYYEGTSCTPSVVGKAIRPMLQHFAENRDANFTYSLFGHYSSGADSIETPLTVEYVKKKFLTYTESGIKHLYYDELGLADGDIKSFLKRFELDLYADKYENQIEKIIEHIKAVLNCTEYDARYFYYNNAVAFVKDTAVKKTASARTITKRKFLEAIGTKAKLFDLWYIELIGYEKYYKAARKQFFTETNISPMNRLFLIECDTSINDTNIADLIMKVGEKWSRLSQREIAPFCPYVYLHGLSAARLANVKRTLLDNDFHIWDGHEFKDSEFSLQSLLRPVNFHVGVKLKIINKSGLIKDILKECTGQKAVYQFYLTKPFFDRGAFMGKDFQIQYTGDVLKIV